MIGARVAAAPIVKATIRGSPPPRRGELVAGDGLAPRSLVFGDGFRFTGMEAIVTAKSDHDSAAGVLGVEQRVTIGVPLFAVNALPAPQGGFAGEASRQRGS
jgi:hypothetical protein